MRGHRRVDTPTVKWMPKSESGNTVEGRATFDPPISSSLLVTLYQKKVNIVIVSAIHITIFDYLLHVRRSSKTMK